ncbi:MAG: hypothetical protein A3D33_15250 [Candidatus Rokubacteria bacterium RIFCSPHIGHO2_02_FULL_73_26]|nr:MAG: hypothetical protein A3D33_15250 [Candidatus Rokubacteria bacterium RIFCSPHIGHO2_02_FULL_73_26]
MTPLLRGLDALTAALVAVAAWETATGGATLAGVSLTRVEDVVVALAGVAGLRWLVRPWPLPAVRPARAVAVGVVAYALGMSFVAVTRHWALRTHALDLGQYVQVIWSLAMGHGARTTMPTTPNPISFWGEHFSPVFYLLAPLEWLAPGAEVLLVAQTLILAAGGVAVFGFARRRLGAPAAAVFALLYLLNPSLHGINIRDIHPQAFAIPLLVAAAWAFDAGRPAWCAAALVLTLACREDAAVAVVGFGLWLAVARRRRALGAAVAAAALAVLVVDLQVLMPPLRGAPYSHLHRWAYLGASVGEILTNAVLRPWRWLAVGLAPAKLFYLAKVLAPLGFLPLLAPRALLAAAPTLAMNLLSVDPILINHRAQYQSFVLPFLVLAAVEGWGALRARAVAGRRPAPAGVLAFALVASVAMTARTVNDFTVTRWWPGAEQRAAWALMTRVPPEASVTANDRIVAHLATRREIYLTPTNVGKSEYVFERVSEVPAPPEGYRLVAREGNWVLYRRGEPGARRERRPSS